MAIQYDCSSCALYCYDEEYGDYLCDADMDEDDLYRSYSDSHTQCPYYQNGDEYAVVRRQM